MVDVEIFMRKFREGHINKINRIINDRETSEDVVQEAYARALKYKDKYDENRSSFPTWFNKILFNTLKDFQRQYKKDLCLVHTDIDMYEDTTDAYINNLEELIYDVNNPKHRSVLILFYVLGYTTSQISNIEGVSVTNVTTICNRFKKKMEELK